MIQLNSYQFWMLFCLSRNIIVDTTDADYYPSRVNLVDLELITMIENIDINEAGLTQNEYSITDKGRDLIKFLSISSALFLEEVQKS